MPSSHKAKKVIFSLLPTSQGKIYELGSGWGHLAFPLARHFPKMEVLALEGSPLPWFFSEAVQKIMYYPNLKIARKNFFNTSLRDADGIVCYLYPKAMERLKEKFEKELKPGAFVITNTFAIPGWKPDKVLIVDDLWRSQIYLYYV